MRFGGVVLVLMVLLSIGGCVINMNLTRKHTSKSNPDWFAAGCTPEDNPAYNCDVVLASRWAVVSPKTLSFVEPDPDTGAQPGIPVALAGWFYFIGLGAWFAAIGRPSYARRYWHLLPTLFVVAGCASSAFFTYILLARMDVKCLWCLVSHGINFLLLGGTLYLWPRKPAAPAAEEETGEDTGGAPALERHPSVRLVLVTAALALGLMYAAYNRAFGERYRYEASVYRAQLDEIAKDAETQMSQLQGQIPVRIHLREDDPRRGEVRNPLLVVFSDFQCPACRSFARDLEKKIGPAFDNQLRVVWKHYPLCKECNPHVARNLHAKACEAAYAAEAARLQGGNDAFWRIHDYLYDHPRLLQQRRIDWGRVAQELELDAERFLADAQSDAVKQRVKEDIEQAKKIKVKSTPSIFLDGRRVKRYMLSNKHLLGLLKQGYQRERKAALRRRHRRGHRQTPTTQPGASPTPAPRTPQTPRDSSPDERDEQRPDPPEGRGARR